jgi:hypothetical protein
MNHCVATTSVTRVRMEALFVRIEELCKSAVYKNVVQNYVKLCIRRSALLVSNLKPLRSCSASQ